MGGMQAANEEGEKRSRGKKMNNKKEERLLGGGMNTKIDEKSLQTKVKKRGR